jgi:hypothetical protein
MIVLVQTVDGVAAVDLDEELVLGLGEDEVEPPPPVPVPLPRVVATAAAGSTVVAVVDTRPPMMVSHDGGVTWRDSGRGLPPGRAVAISDDDPDLVVYASRNRLFVSRDGGRFWTSLAVELPEIEALGFA